MFLYPFEPLKPHNAYLIALVYPKDGKQNYRIELDSEDVDQAFFKPKKAGERRFSIDSYRKNVKNENWPESQALHGFIDGYFDYDTMRDRMLTVPNGEEPSKNENSKKEDPQPKLEAFDVEKSDLRVLSIPRSQNRDLGHPNPS